MMRTTDSIVYPSRATANEAYQGVRKIYGTDPPWHVGDFLLALEGDCAEASLDFAVVASHAANECDIWRDRNWRDKFNAFGIGITGPGVAGVTFPSPEACAQFAVAEYLMKLRRPLGRFADARQFAPVKFDRVAAIVKRADFPKVERIRDLNQTFGDDDCVWMCDETGPEAIIAKGNALFPDLPDQDGASATPNLTIDVDLVNRGLGTLRDRDAWITVHNTGNNAPRQAERQFVADGGGDEGVAYHFAVDETGATQIMTLNTRGIHAGNAEGNATSIAIEMCMNREPWAMIKENTAHLLAAIVTRDTRLRFGNDAHAFSLDRVREHRDWPGANPACPQRLIQTDGGVEKIVTRARQIVAERDTLPPSPNAKPVPIPGPIEVKRIGSTLYVPVLRSRIKALRDVKRLHHAADDAPEVGKPVAKGSAVTAAYITSGMDGKLWYVSAGGSYLDADAFIV